MRSRLAAAPGWVWLAALVLVSFAVRFAFARHMVGPWIMIDEIVYSELAKSFAATGHFAVREQPTTGYGFVYPILISPAYALFRQIPTVYTGIKLINALLMSFAAVPAYLLARRVVSQSGALVVAVLTVAVPSTFYAGTVMTENAFYPIFLLCALALVAALDRPTVARVVVFLAVLVLAYETRAQAVAVLAAALTAPLVLAAFARRPRELLAHRWLYAIVAGAALLAVAAELARGKSIQSLFGAYAVATNSSYDAGTVLHWLLWHLAELDLYVAFVPVLALVLLCVRGGALPSRERTVVAVTVSLVLWLGVEVAAFASKQSGRIEERNLFYVAPLLYLCLVLWIERGLPRPRVPALAAAAAVVVLAGAIPYDRFVDTSATSDTFGVLMLWSLAEWFSLHVEWLRWIVAAASVVAVALALTLPRRLALVLPLLALGVSALAVQPVDSRTQRASIGAVFQGITKPDRDWITAIVGTGDPTRVAVVWSGSTDRLTVNENEFFNRDVGAVYTINGAVPGGLAETALTLDRARGYYLAGGKRVDVADALTDTSAPLVGRRIGADEKKGLVLMRVDGPLRAANLVTGVFPDQWMERTARFRRFACRGGTLAVTLGSDAHLFRRPQLVQALVAGRPVASVRVPPDAEATLRARLRPRGDVCDVTLHVPHTRVPGPQDRRHLGIRVLAVS
ncbi:MAG TPA: glycosyltransferase family 39 protein [Gaiellaceae bacterium]